MRVAIFSSDSTSKLEESMNAFLRKNENFMKVVDIKFNETMCVDDETLFRRFSSLIMYAVIED